MYHTSREWEIDRRIGELIGRMVDRTVTPADKQELESLIRERAKLLGSEAGKLLGKG